MCIIPAAARARVYFAERRMCAHVYSRSFSNSLESRRQASVRVKRSDFYCISQLGTAAGNCAQTFCFTVFSSSLFHYSFLFSPSFLLSCSFLVSSFSLSLSLFVTREHPTPKCPHCRTTCTIHFAMFLYSRSNK